MRASSDMAEVIEHAELILMVIPTQFVTSTLVDAGQYFRPDHILCSCSKVPGPLPLLPP